MSLYRQAVDPRQAALFRKEAAAAATDVDTQKLGYIGLIGSALASRSVHDLDVLVFPAQTAPTGAALSEMFRYFRTLDARLKESGYYVAPSPRKIMQGEINHIARQERGKGNLSTHTLFFPDYRSFVNLNPAEFAETVEREQRPLLGEFAVIKRRKEIPQAALEPYLLTAEYQIPLIEACYPPSLVLSKTEELLDYLESRYGFPVDRTDFGKADPRDCSRLAQSVLLELDRAA